MSEGIDLNIIDGSRECIFCHCWYFFDINFQFDSKVCNCCHDIILKAVNFNVVNITVKGKDYTIHSLYMSKHQAINLLRDANLTERRRTL